MERTTPHLRNPIPVRQLALCKNDLALIGHFDAQLAVFKKDLLKLTKRTASRGSAFIRTTPGIGDYASK